MACKKSLQPRRSKRRHRPTSTYKFLGDILLCGSVCVLALLLYLVKMVHQCMRHSSRSSQSFLSFVIEKENHVHKMEEPEESKAKRKQRKRISNGRVEEHESINF